MNSEITSVDFCRALSDPTRQRILEMLMERELSVSEIVESFHLSQPTVSHHLDTLNRYGLLTSRKDGKQVFYRTDSANVTMCCGMLMSKYAVDHMNTPPKENK